MCVSFFCGKSGNYEKIIGKMKNKPLLQFVCKLYNCQFCMAPDSDRNDGTPSPQTTKYSMCPLFDWDSANIRIWKGAKSISTLVRLRPEGCSMQCKVRYKQWHKWQYSLWPPRHWDAANKITFYTHHPWYTKQVDENIVMRKWGVQKCVHEGM